MGTVSGRPRTHTKPASEGPAPPRRPGTLVVPDSSSTRTPSDCSSTRSRRSSMSSVRSATTGEELLVVLPEHALLELLRDAPDAVDLPVLGVEEHAVAADPGALDLGEQPARAEPDRPRGVGVDLVALLDPGQELRHELDVPGDAPAEVDEVDLAALPVALDQGHEVRDVRVAARAGVEVEHEVVLLAHVEAFVGDLQRVL